MRLLIVNDDGINARGIQILAKELHKHHEVIVAAPNVQRSASSHSITLNSTLTIKEEIVPEVDCPTYSINGTPADCTRLAVEKLMNFEVDLVISGINDGYNLGTDVLYSGTVSAAIEAAVVGVPAIAISCDGTEEGFRRGAEYALKVIEKLKDNKLSENIVLNVNIPKTEAVKGIKICSMGERIYKDVFFETLSEEGSRTYDIKGTPCDSDDETTDVGIITKGYVTVTPLHYDLTNYNILKETEKVFSEE
ncbi:5'/3'-nucleotidase SurE [Clostridium cellulovorans]|uniref:5'-nucleotidase SurE n=1 Tax=Clostridium cellulovorans (strain ATCC 35296 / DSM 3052 / OCM 3 / 743B) TaxID=573061 RepID=D9SVR2_CLOC7|nr:5'/3'-nucleotidase SurE [Clostridium cellulovorans]ADL53123.1 stationary-phase survival protein SurE [Clostridium cellulovorans 743B]